MKRLVAAAIAAAMLSGCTAGLVSYPQVEVAPPVEYAPKIISLNIPSTADDILSESMVLLEAKLQSMTDNKVKLETTRVGNVLDEYHNGDEGLYLMSGRQMEQLDERMRFIQMPFLFPDREKLFALLNSEKGPVRGSSATASRLQGEVIGVYYGGTTWMISRGRFYDDIGFYNTVGVLSHMAGNSSFGAIGGEKIIEGSHGEIMAAFAEEKVKFCELRLGSKIPREAFDKIKYIEPTNHRYDGWWLVLKNHKGEIDSELVGLVREAFAYTIEQQNEQRLAVEEEYKDNLVYGSGVEMNDESTYQNTLRNVKKYYRDNWKELGIPEDIWKQIQIVM